VPPSHNGRSRKGGGRVGIVRDAQRENDSESKMRIALVFAPVGVRPGFLTNPALAAADTAVAHIAVPFAAAMSLERWGGHACVCGCECGCV